MCCCCFGKKKNIAKINSKLEESNTQEKNEFNERYTDFEYIIENLAIKQAPRELVDYIPQAYLSKEKLKKLKQPKVSFKSSISNIDKLLGAGEQIPLQESISNSEEIIRVTEDPEQEVINPTKPEEALTNISIKPPSPLINIPAVPEEKSKTLSKLPSNWFQSIDKPNDDYNKLRSRIPVKNSPPYWFNAVNRSSSAIVVEPKPSNLNDGADDDIEIPLEDIVPKSNQMLVKDVVEPRRKLYKDTSTQLISTPSPEPKIKPSYSISQVIPPKVQELPRNEYSNSFNIPPDLQETIDSLRYSQPPKSLPGMPARNQRTLTKHSSIEPMKEKRRVLSENVPEKSNPLEDKGTGLSKIMVPNRRGFTKMDKEKMFKSRSSQKDSEENKKRNLHSYYARQSTSDSDDDAPKLKSKEDRKSGNRNLKWKIIVKHHNKDEDVFHA